VDFLDNCVDGDYGVLYGRVNERGGVVVMFNRKLKKRIKELEIKIGYLERKVEGLNREFWSLECGDGQLMRDISDEIQRKFREMVNANPLLKVGTEVNVRDWEDTYRLTFNLGYGWKLVNTKTGYETWAYNSDIIPVSVR
jgi:uncharacterized coiled-coil protein SlyX